MEPKIKCLNCGRILCGNMPVWQVRYADRNATIHYGPCCSESCAEKEREKSVSFLKHLLYPIEHQAFQKMSVENYLENA